MQVVHVRRPRLGPRLHQLSDELKVPVPESGVVLDGFAARQAENPLKIVNGGAPCPELVRLAAEVDDGHGWLNAGQPWLLGTHQWHHGVECEPAGVVEIDLTVDPGPGVPGLIGKAQP